MAFENEVDRLRTYLDLAYAHVTDVRETLMCDRLAGLSHPVGQYLAFNHNDLADALAELDKTANLLLYIELEQGMEELQNDFDNLKQETWDLENEYSALEMENAELEERISELEQEIANLEHDNGYYQQEIEELTRG